MPIKPPPHPTGTTPPPIPKIHPPTRRHRHGRQRTLGQRTRTPTQRRTPRRRNRPTRRRRRSHRNGHPLHQRLRLLHRKLETLTQRSRLHHAILHRSPQPPTRNPQILGVRIRWAGRRPKLWKNVIEQLEQCERETRNNTICTLTMCVNYGGRAEIADAAAAIARDVQAGTLKPNAITEKPSKNTSTNQTYPM